MSNSITRRLLNTPKKGQALSTEPTQVSQSTFIGTTYDIDEVQEIYLRSRSLEGKTVGNWKLEVLLGEGGMSTVYLGKHKFLEKRRAIKLLHPEKNRNKDLLRRFQDEAKVISTLKHPNIIQISDFGIDPQHGFFMALEYLEGQDLEAHMSQTPFPQHWWLGVFEQICAGLQVTHDAGIIHRDIKPSNIFLLPGKPLPSVKLLDFGIAKQTADSARSKITQTGLVIGTPSYMAPEQLTPGEEVTLASDIYSLGVLLYQCITGNLPIVGNTPLGLLFEILREEPTPIGTFRPELKGSALEALLLNMLNKDPEKRPQSASEVWEQLLTAMHGQTLEVPNSAPKISVPSIPLVNFNDQKAWANTISPDSSNGLNVEAYLPTENFPTQSKKKSWAVAISILALLAIGYGWFQILPSQPKEQPKLSISKVKSAKKPANKHVTLNNLVIQGKAAFAKKEYALAIKLWKKATQSRSWKKSSHRTQVLKALGVAYTKKKELYNAVQFFRAYQKEMQALLSRVKELREQIAKSRSPSKLKLYKRELAELLRRLPKQRDFDKEFQYIQELEGLLAKRTETGHKLLERLKKVWRQKRWKQIRILLFQIQTIAPTIPTIQLEVAKVLSNGFEWRSLAHLQSIRTHLAIQPEMEQKLAILAYKVKKKAQKNQQIWKSNLTLMSKQVRDGNIIQAIRKSTYLVKRFYRNTRFQADWQRWLDQQTPKTPYHMTSFWKLHLQHSPDIQNDMLKNWKTSPSVPKVKSNSKIVRTKLRWLRKNKYVYGRYKLSRSQLHNNEFFLAFQSLNKLLPASRSLLRSGPKAWSQYLYPLRKIAAKWLQRKHIILRHHNKAQYFLKIARFTRAAQEQTQLIKVLGTSIATPKAKRTLIKFKQRQRRAQMLLQKAKRAFQKEQWAEARKHFKSFLVQFPKAYQLKRIQANLKTCRCALQIYPWEICPSTKQ